MTFDRPVCAIWRTALLGAVFAAACPAQPGGASESEVRAAFLYQLAQYAVWPAQPEAGKPIRLCVTGDARLAKALSLLVANKNIDGRRVVAGPAELSEIGACSLAFLASANRRSIQELSQNWEYPPVLLVGESEGFAENGGMVNLSLEGGRVSFEVNLSSLRRAGLSLRSQLLRFARIVKPQRGPK